MTPTGVPHGELLVETTGQPPEGFSAGRQLVPSCRLLLQPSTGQPALSLLLANWPESTTIKQVPYGSYSPNVTLNNHLLRYRPEENPLDLVKVGVEPARIAIDVSDMSALQVEVSDAQAIYQGTVLFTISSAGSSNAVFLSFEAPPYGVLGISPGDYELRFKRPFTTPDDHPVLVRIVGRETARLSVAIPH